MSFSSPELYPNNIPSLLDELLLRQKLNRIWKMKDGKSVRVGDMTQKHLYNTIKMIEKTMTERGWPIRDWFDDDNGNSGEVVVGYEPPIKSLQASGYQGLVDVYNYRFGEKK